MAEGIVSKKHHFFCGKMHVSVQPILDVPKDFIAIQFLEYLGCDEPTEQLIQCTELFLEKFKQELSQ